MAIAYGQITLTDLTDLGQFSVNPQSNTPLTQIYNPNTDTYTPNWSTSGSNVEITGICYYGAQDVTSSCTLTWTRQDGNATPSSLITGETYSSTTKKLTISANVLGTSTSKLITYYCTATYTEPESGTVLTAKGQITFNLQQVATTIKNAKITGQNAFLYQSGSSTPTSTSIVLTGSIANGDFGGWKYKNSSGNFVTLAAKSGDTNLTRTINYNDSIFVNDVATIKFYLSGLENDVYDIFSITNIRDGAAGNNNIVASLSNESQMIPFNSQGEGDFTNAVSTITIYDGSDDITTSYSISTTPVGVTGSYNSSTKTYTVASMTGDTGYVTFTATKTGSATLQKRFNLTKVQAGADGTSPTIYSLEPSTVVTVKSISGTYTPSSVTFSAFSQHGSDAKQAYTGRIAIYVNGSTTPDSGLSGDASTKTITFSSISNLAKLEAKLFLNGSSTGTPLDTQTVAVANDGATGATGAQGPGAYQVLLGNEVEMIPCTSTGNTSSAMTINIPITAYQGITPITVTTGTIQGLPSGITKSSSSTASNLVLSVASNSGLGGNDSGDVTIPFSYGGSTIATCIFHWYKSKAAVNGTNAVLFQVFSSNNTIVNGVGTASIDTSLIDGSVEKTAPDVTYQWYKYNGSSYQAISGATNKTLTGITAADIDSATSFKCIATYNSIGYSGFCTIYDKTDPIQIVLMSSVGEILKNGVGVGAVYPMITRNGTPYLPMKTYDGQVVCSASAPTGKTGQYYYHLDTTNKQVLCKKWTGSAWANDDDTTNPDASVTGGITYAYTFTNASGVSVEYDAVTSRKCLFLDGALFENKIVVNLSVTV